jgi:membrane dipeptidase
VVTAFEGSTKAEGYYPALAMSDTISLRKVIAGDNRLVPVQRTDDIIKCASSGKCGVIVGFQNAKAISDDIRLLELFYELGLRVMQLTYNERNLVGDGCGELSNAGLSNFGKEVIRELNRLGVLIDLSHTGIQTTLEAIEYSEAPVAFTHANARAVYDTARNKTDEEIKALAQKGGVIGINAFPDFVKEEAPSIEDLLNHVEYTANLVGIENIGIGLDFIEGRTREQSTDLRGKVWDHDSYALRPDLWKTDFRYPNGIESIRDLPNLRSGLQRRGFSERDVEKILGLNFLGLMKKVFKN